MLTLITEISCAAVTAVAFFFWLSYQWALRREAQTLRWEVSRFPMYEARDALVRLAVDGKMGDSDPAWRALYEDVNNLLQIQNKHSMVQVARKYVRYLAAIDQNTELQAKRQAEFARDNKAAEEVPEFGAIRKAVHKCVSQVLNRHATNAVRRWLGTFVVFLDVTAITARRGLRIGRMLWSALDKPEARDISHVSRPAYAGTNSGAYDKINFWHT